jgi:hypothetical protein
MKSSIRPSKTAAIKATAPKILAPKATDINAPALKLALVNVTYKSSEKKTVAKDLAIENPLASSLPARGVPAAKRMDSKPSAIWTTYKLNPMLMHLANNEGGINYAHYRL